MAAMRRKEHATRDLIYCSASTAKLAASLLKRMVDWPGLSLGDTCSVCRIRDSLLMKIGFLEATYPREGKHSHAMESDGLTCSLDEGTALSAPSLGQGNA